MTSPDLKKITENDPVPIELEPYVKKLNSSRRRVMLVNSILQNVQVHFKAMKNLNNFAIEQVCIMFQ